MSIDVIITALPSADPQPENGNALVKIISTYTGPFLFEAQFHVPYEGANSQDEAAEKVLNKVISLAEEIKAGAERAKHALRHKP